MQKIEEIDLMMGLMRLNRGQKTKRAKTLSKKIISLQILSRFRSFTSKIRITNVHASPVFECKKDVSQSEKKLNNTWIYAFNLPYNMQTKQINQIIDYLQNQYGPIKQYEVQTKKDLLGELIKADKVYHLPDTIQYRLGEKLKFQLVQKKNKIDELPQRKLIRGENKKSLKFLDKMENQTEYKLNRSTMLINFSKIKSKQQFFSQDIRLYGLTLGKIRNIRFEEGSSKTVVSLHDIPWGCESHELLLTINSLLEKHGIPIDIPSQESTITRHCIFLKFVTLAQARTCIKLLHQFKFQSSVLKATLAYGQCKIYKEQYTQQLQFNFKQNLRKRLAECKSHYDEIMGGAEHQ